MSEMDFALCGNNISYHHYVPELSQSSSPTTSLEMPCQGQATISSGRNQGSCSSASGLGCSWPLDVNLSAQPWFLPHPAPQGTIIQVTPPGSLIPLAPPWSIVALPTPQTSGLSAKLCPSPLRLQEAPSSFLGHLCPLSHQRHPYPQIIWLHL